MGSEWQVLRSKTRVEPSLEIRVGTTQTQGTGTSTRAETENRPGACDEQECPVGLGVVLLKLLVWTRARGHVK